MFFYICTSVAIWTCRFFFFVRISSVDSESLHLVDKRSQEATSANEVHDGKDERCEIEHAHDGHLERMKLGIEESMTFVESVARLVPPTAVDARQFEAHLFRVDVSPHGTDKVKQSQWFRYGFVVDPPHDGDACAEDADRHGASRSNDALQKEEDRLEKKQDDSGDSDKRKGNNRGDDGCDRRCVGGVVHDNW